MRDHSLERLYRLLPGHIRAIDAAEGRPLQALMQLFARELEIVEGDTDALYDNWFIETCEDWAVPYIGELVGARALRPFGGGLAARLCRQHARLSPGAKARSPRSSRSRATSPAGPALRSSSSAG